MASLVPREIHCSRCELADTALNGRRIHVDTICRKPLERCLDDSAQDVADQNAASSSADATTTRRDLTLTRLPLGVRKDERAAQRAGEL